ncbi:MAG: phosphosulfolactate synthase [Anaerolineales bacterium]
MHIISLDTFEQVLKEQYLTFSNGGSYIVLQNISASNLVRTDLVDKIINAINLEKPMVEVADPEVFAWYIKNYGAEVNLFVDHSQIVQLETIRA